jgi:hypothetical protein
MEGIRALRAAGIPVVLRIDPLFPRSPLPTEPVKNMRDFGLIEAQTLEDLEQIVLFGKRTGVRHVAYSPAKIVLTRGRTLTPPMRNLLCVYRALSEPGKPVWRGGSWRLPRGSSDTHVTEPFLAICRRLQMPAKFCMKNLLDTG